MVRPAYSTVIGTGRHRDSNVPVNCRTVSSLPSQCEKVVEKKSPPCVCQSTIASPLSLNTRRFPLSLSFHFCWYVRIHTRARTHTHAFFHREPVKMAAVLPRRSSRSAWSIFFSKPPRLIALKSTRSYAKTPRLSLDIIREIVKRWTAVLTENAHSLVYVSRPVACIGENGGEAGVKAEVTGRSRSCRLPVALTCICK